MYYYGARYYDPKISLFISPDPLAEQFVGWSAYHYVHNNPINLVDPTGMAAEEPDNRYRIYKKEGKIQRIEYVNDDGGDNTDYITEIDMDQPMMYASSSKSYTTGVQKYKSKVKTNLSSKDGQLSGTWRGPGYRYDFEYQAQSQAIEPMGIDSPFFIAGGVASKFLSRVSAAKGGLTFNNGVKESFIKHFNSGGRHADLGLSVETMASKGMNLVESNIHLLKAGDNTLIGNINGIQKSFKAFVKDEKIMSINMYSGVSNRVTQVTIINFGNVSW